MTKQDNLFGVEFHSTSTGTVRPPIDNSYDCSTIWSKPCDYGIPSWVEVVKITCLDFQGGYNKKNYGLMAAFNNGVVSDSSWQCYSVSSAGGDTVVIITGSDHD